MRAWVALALGAALCSVLAVIACSSNQAETQSYLLVELGPAESALIVPRNVHISVAPEGLDPISLCMNIAGQPGAVTASLVLGRSPDRDPSLPVKLTVTPYGTMTGAGSPGQGFTCPTPLPNPIGPDQVLQVAVCPGEARKIRFEVAAHCACTDSGTGGSGGTGGHGGAAGGTGGGSGGAAGGSAGSGGGTGLGGAGGSASADAGVGGEGLHDAGELDAGSSCLCETGGVCGAGVSASGSRCQPDECCKGALHDPCIELEVAH